jgi:hypothetical protein
MTWVFGIFINRMLCLDLSRRFPPNVRSTLGVLPSVVGVGDGVLFSLLHRDFV